MVVCARPYAWRYSAGPAKGLCGHLTLSCPAYNDVDGYRRTQNIAGLLKLVSAELGKPGPQGSASFLQDSGASLATVSAYWSNASPRPKLQPTYNDAVRRFPSCSAWANFVVHTGPEF